MPLDFTQLSFALTCLYPDLTMFNHFLNWVAILEVYCISMEKGIKKTGTMTQKVQDLALTCLVVGINHLGWDMNVKTKNMT